MSVNDTKELIISYEGEKYRVTFKDTIPMKTRSFNGRGEELFRMAKKILRLEAQRLGLTEKDGKIRTKSGAECITNEYFRKIYRVRKNG